MNVESYPADQVARMEYAAALAALNTTQRVRRDQLDVLHGDDDLQAMIEEGLVVTEGVIAGHAELTPKGLYWINRRLLVRRAEQGPPVPTLARLHTHHPTMHSWWVCDVPIGSIMSLYTSTGPREVEITGRDFDGERVILTFADGPNGDIVMPYDDPQHKVYVFAPLDMREPRG